MNKLFPALLFLLFATAVPMTAQTDLRFNGSSTTAKMLKPVAAGIESTRGVRIVFTPNGTGHGVADLAAGQADVAMVTGTIEYFGKLLNEKTPGSIDLAKVRVFRLADLPANAATAIVHPDITVASLSRDQLRDLFSGQIKNWKQVGGPDLPVVPIMPDALDGVGAALTVMVMRDTPYAAQTVRVGKATELAPLVEKTPGAIAFCSVANATGGVAKVATVPQFIPPNYLVTIGEPGEPLKSVIADFVAQVK